MSEELYNSGDFIELLIKGIYRSSAVYERAKAAGLQPTDVGNIDIYREFVTIAIEVGEAPIAQDILLMQVKQKLKTGVLDKSQQDDILTFVEFIYADGHINEQYILGHVIPFFEQRRFTQIRDNAGSAREVAEQATKLVYELDNATKSTSAESMNPFDVVTFSAGKTAMGLGLPTVDQCAYGLAYGEYGMIIGYSGTGKTALATFSLVRRALEGTKVQYISLEEPGLNINNRLYSNILKIPYTELHLGKAAAGMRLADEVPKMDPQIRKALTENLRVKDLRNEAPVSTRFIKDFLDRQYAETGWHPELVYIDQMDYLAPTVDMRDQWQNYWQCSLDTHEFCKGKIGGEHPYAVWLMHQAAGKMRRAFSNGEISGFKGIIKPCDLVVGIGKDQPSDTVVNIFSLKVRHCSNFSHEYLTHLEYMQFEPYDKAAQLRMIEACKEVNGAKKKPAAKKAADKAKGAGLFKNIPDRENKLPNADGWRQ